MEVYAIYGARSRLSEDVGFRHPGHRPTCSVIVPTDSPAGIRPCRCGIIVARTCGA
jgi:hypothetical protein